MGVRVSPHDFGIMLETMNAQVVTIIGHNQDGIFRFTNGFSANLYELDNICIKRKYHCVFLSCSAKKYLVSSGIATSSPITPLEAVHISIKLSEKISNNADTTSSLNSTLSNLQEIVSTLESSAKRKLKVITISQKVGGTTAVGGSIGSGITVVSENFEHNSKSYQAKENTKKSN